MKRVIRPISEGLTIEISETAGKEEPLLKAFQECQEGRCSCPTDEYSKLDSLEVEKSNGNINLRLKAKKGQEFNKNEIEKCLDYADEQVDPTE